MSPRRVSDDNDTGGRDVFVDKEVVVGSKRVDESVRERVAVGESVL